jgi:hypothetical protein
MLSDPATDVNDIGTDEDGDTVECRADPWAIRSQIEACISVIIAINFERSYLESGVTARIPGQGVA